MTETRLTSRQRFLSACRCEPLDRPPLWIMRQAGRYLPEYRKLKAEFTFQEMVRNPELAVEITLQPIRRFHFDAAILFSDILVVPEALGQAYAFKDSGGIVMERRLDSRADIESLAFPDAIPEKLAHIEKILQTLREELSDTTALLGFGGSPWTLACYMLEGASSNTFSRAKFLYHAERKCFDLLLEKLSEALIRYFKMQIAAGVDAIQIFDSWGGILAAEDYEQASLQWIRRILAALPKDFPVILYSKGCAPQWFAQSRCGAKIISVDWTADLPALRKQFPDTVALQGNLDPVLLETRPEIVRDAASRLLQAMATAFPGHIFNLGHGITPSASIENVETLVETVFSWKSQNNLP